MMKSACPRYNEEEPPWVSWVELEQGNLFALIDQSLDLL